MEGRCDYEEPHEKVEVREWRRRKREERNCFLNISTATLFLEFWKRERNIRAFQWNMLDYEEEVRSSLFFFFHLFLSLFSALRSNFQ